MNLEETPLLFVSQSEKVDMFLKITSGTVGLIKGESQDAGKHKDEIQVLAFRYGVFQPHNIDAQPTGRRQHRLLSVLIETCIATPLLFRALTIRDHFKEVVLSVRKSGGKTKDDYLVYTLKNAYLADFRTGFLCGDEVIPRDQLDICFRTITIDCKAQKADGSLGSLVSATDDWHNGG